MSALIRRTFIATRSVTRTHSARALSASAVTRKDLVQDLYLREIKAYKAPPAAKDAHVGAVKNFTSPAAPSAPSIPSDLAAELAQYDAAEPGASSPSTASGSAAGEGAGGAREFLTFLEADFPKEEAHH